MNQRTNAPSLRVLIRTLLASSAAAIVLLGQTSCNGLGFGKRGADDDEATAYIDPEETPKRHRSLFERSKNKNAYINEDIQTTRRDRYAAQNATTFAPSPEGASISPDSFTGQPTPGINTPLSPRSDLELDPEPASVGSRPSPPAESNLRLPSLDSDFPQPGGALPPPAVPDLGTTAPRKNEDDGYIPLQPKLPGAESIRPPSE